MTTDITKRLAFILVHHHGVDPDLAAWVAERAVAAAEGEIPYTGEGRFEEIVAEAHRLLKGANRDANTD